MRRRPDRKLYDARFGVQLICGECRNTLFVPYATDILDAVKRSQYLVIGDETWCWDCCNPEHQYD